MAKKNKKSAGRLEIAVKIFAALILSVICFGLILNLGGGLKIPVTPCFYMGTTANVAPTKPCIDFISWQTYQILMVILIAALTWGWFQVFNGRWIKNAK